MFGHSGSHAKSAVGHSPQDDARVVDRRQSALSPCPMMLPSRNQIKSHRCPRFLRLRHSRAMRLLALPYPVVIRTPDPELQLNFQLSCADNANSPRNNHQTSFPFLVLLPSFIRIGDHCYIINLYSTFPHRLSAGTTQAGGSSVLGACTCQ
jgi:hypothetical protein